MREDRLDVMTQGAGAPRARIRATSQKFSSRNYWAIIATSCRADEASSNTASNSGLNGRAKIDFGENLAS